MPFLSSFVTSIFEHRSFVPRRFRVGRRDRNRQRLIVSDLMNLSVNTLYWRTSLTYTTIGIKYKSYFVVSRPWVRILQPALIKSSGSVINRTAYWAGSQGLDNTPENIEAVRFFYRNWIVHRRSASPPKKRRLGTNARRRRFRGRARE